MTHMSREIHLKSRPVGVPTPENFEFVETAVPDPGPGQLLIQNIYMSVDPYMRGRMVDRKSYVPPFQVGEVMSGGNVGRVLQSNHDGFAAGQYVMGMEGWREYYLSDGRGLRPVSAEVAPIQAFLGTLGMPGMTAYFGLLAVGELKEGETVFVSAAAGAVGSVVCQIAKIKGCRVIGSAGSATKIKYLTEDLGVDTAFNYKEVTDITAELGDHAPDGIDVYFENVGGEHLEAAIQHMNDYGRVVCCGMISQYNAIEPACAPRNLNSIVRKRLTLKGFIVTDFMDRAAQFFQDMGAWVRAGDIIWKETIVEGIENAPDAFLGLFSGDNLGKMLVKLGPDPAA